MKAIVENTPVELNDNDKDYNMLSWFNEILLIITKSETEEELRDLMSKKIGNNKRYFKYGFGSNHMWVCQTYKKYMLPKEDIDEGKRLIFVEF